MPTALLFLDFDGVLHPCLAGTFIYMERFEVFLRAHPQLRVVLSTSWRCDHPWEQLLALFSPDLRDRFIGATPNFEVLGGPAVREREIQAWRAANRVQSLRWAALDDDASLFSPGCPQLVLCETVRGLRPQQLAKLKELLTG